MLVGSKNGTNGFGDSTREKIDRWADLNPQHDKVHDSNIERPTTNKWSDDDH